MAPQMDSPKSMSQRLAEFRLIPRIETFPWAVSFAQTDYPCLVRLGLVRLLPKSFPCAVCHFDHRVHDFHARVPAFTVGGYPDCVSRAAILQGSFAFELEPVGHCVGQCSVLVRHALAQIALWAKARRISPCGLYSVDPVCVRGHAAHIGILDPVGSGRPYGSLYLVHRICAGRPEFQARPRSADGAGNLSPLVGILQYSVSVGDSTFSVLESLVSLFPRILEHSHLGSSVGYERARDASGLAFAVGEPDSRILRVHSERVHLRALSHRYVPHGWI